MWASSCRAEGAINAVLEEPWEGKGRLQVQQAGGEAGKVTLP